MKKTYVLSAFLFLFMGIFSSCGSSKNTQSETLGFDPMGTKLKKSDVQMHAEESPETRAWGNAQHFRSSVANNLAELQARGKFARSIEAAILSASKSSGLAIEKYAGSNDTGSSVSDQGTKDNDFLEGIAQAIVKNAIPVKSDEYMLPNRQYNVYVCLEYRGAKDEVVEGIIEKIENKIPSDQRKELETEFEKFENDLKENLAK